MNMCGITGTKFRTGERVWIINNDKVIFSLVKAIELWPGEPVRYHIYDIIGYFLEDSIFKSSEEAQMFLDERLEENWVARRMTKNGY